MKSTTPTRRVILDAAIEGSVIRGTLTGPAEQRREFHGWLELNAALEAILELPAGRAPDTFADGSALDDFGVGR
jgi:hypothetical protein